MSVRPGSPTGPSARRRTAMMAGLLALTTLAAACSSGNTTAAKDAPSASASASASPTPVRPDVTVTSNLPAAGKTMHVDATVRLRATKGTFDSVSMSTLRGAAIKGTLSPDKTSWASTTALEPGVTYRVKSVAVDEHGRKLTQTKTFKSDPLTLDQQTFPSIAPLPGETVGVGMPVIVHFDVPVTDKKSIERHLHVTNTSGQNGSWHWISDYEVHWRPEQYWKPGTDVTVRADVNSVSAGNGIYGQTDRETTFHVGDAIISRVDVKAHEMKVYDNGRLLRTMPISAGKPGFITRSGIKVIVEKRPKMVMDAATVGIPKNSPNYYKLKVLWDMRVTYSGEFLHAAPWSDSSHGVANVSHGCVGMSTADAKWLFDLTHGRGDVVEVTGSDRHMTLTNGYGDWNESFSQYATGSALR